MHIDIYSDVVCPWCFIGTARLERALKSLGLAAALQYRTILQPPATPEGGRHQRAARQQKYRADPATMFERVDAEAREAGLDLTTGRQPRTYPTVRAHTLLRHARAKGTQVALKKALFAAYFQQGKNIADPSWLAELATAHGFSRPEAERLLADPQEAARSLGDSEEAHAQGIRGVPFFVFDQALAVSGAQPESVFREALRQAQQQTQQPPARREV